jgi:hypothetical protein
MTREALTAEQTATASGSNATGSAGEFQYRTVGAVESVIAQIEQEIAARRQQIAQLEQVRADLDSKQVTQRQMARYPVLSAREATAQQLASGLDGVTGAPYEVSHLMDVPGGEK